MLPFLGSNQRPVLKGIETRRARRHIALGSSNQRPVLKGIETCAFRVLRKDLKVRIRDPFLRGLRRARAHSRPPGGCSNQRPVLKGIETIHSPCGSSGVVFESETRS